jgi:hypothetical protein
VFVTEDGIRVVRLPFKNLTLLQKEAEPTPSYHFTELYSFLSKNTLQEPIYVHSAPTYAVLLVAAFASPGAKLIVSSEYPDKEMLVSTLVFNNIGEKIIFEDDKDTELNRERAATVLTNSF